MICFAAIAPHGDVDLAPELRAAMEELGRRFDAAAPDVAVVVTPHNVHVEAHFPVVTSARVGEWECDREAAAALVGSMRAERLPAVGVSFGGNDPAEAEMPLDWGADVPLSFMRPRRVVLASPARDRPLAEHVTMGTAIRGLPGRVALIASADHGHAHDRDGPYGFHPAAAAYDARLRELLGRTPLRFEPLVDLVADAKADSLWQLLVLQGAVGEGPARRCSPTPSRPTTGCSAPRSRRRVGDGPDGRGAAAHDADAVIPLVLAVVALGQPVTVTIRPVEARRDVPVRVTVTGVDASRLLVRLRGAQTGAGKATTWLPLVRRVAVWAGSLRTPHYWGVYPLELRAGPAAAPRSSPAWLVKVLPAGFRTRPGFATPREVAAWWVRTGPPRARLVSARPWPAPAGTPHNAYNRLLEVELRLLEPWPPVWPEPGRLTMFVSVTRESLRGPWRFVDVGTGP